MIGEVVRMRAGVNGTRYRVKAVQLAQADNIDARHYVILVAVIDEEENGALFEFRASELRMETLEETRAANPYVKPPPTAMPGDPERRG